MSLVNPDLREYMLNLEDIGSLYGTSIINTAGQIRRNLSTLPPLVEAKVQSAIGFIVTPHIINHALYDNIFVTSDIHTDLEKLNYILNGAGLVSSGTIEHVDDIMRGISPDGPIDWIPEKTLLVIIGDLVDGTRSPGQHHKDDIIGNVELLLHAYLFNLRLKARQKNSEILFTVGNHDFLTVIANVDHSNYWDAYVHNGAKNFFGSRANRRQCLYPFYLCSPYLMIRIAEIACVHGGFHGKIGDNKNMNIGNELAEIQGRIDTNPSPIKFDILTAEEVNMLQDDMRAYPQHIKRESPLFSRVYAKGSTARTCPMIYGSPYEFVIVGHCPTDSGMDHIDELISGPNYSPHCDGGGCVVLGCDNKEGVPGPPTLAYVDITMSGSFRPHMTWEHDKYRRGEILQLIHSEYFEGPRYYNRIFRRKVVGYGVPENILVWSAPPRVTPAIEWPDYGLPNYEINNFEMAGGRRKFKKSKSRKGKSRKGKSRKSKSRKGKSRKGSV